MFWSGVLKLAYNYASWNNKNKSYTTCLRESLSLLTSLNLGNWSLVHLCFTYSVQKDSSGLIFIWVDIDKKILFYYKVASNLTSSTFTAFYNIFRKRYANPFCMFSANAAGTKSFVFDKKRLRVPQVPSLCAIMFANSNFKGRNVKAISDITYRNMPWLRRKLWPAARFWVLEGGW